jgi:hypothetical protein
MTINPARKADNTLSLTFSKEDFDSWMEYLGLPDAIKKVEAETKPEKRAASIRRIFQARAPILLDGYERYYIVANSD